MQTHSIYSSKLALDDGGASALDIRILGMKELNEMLMTYVEKAEPEITRSVNVAAEIVYKRAVELAPVYTGKWPSKVAHAGTLKSSLKLIKGRRTKEGKVFIGRITFDQAAAYAVPLELGHGIMSYVLGNKKFTGEAEPHPFLRPAADETEKEVIMTIMQGVIDSCNRLLGKTT